MKPIYLMRDFKFKNVKNKVNFNILEAFKQYGARNIQFN